MTKDFFIQLSGYNIWANDIVCSWLENISDEQWTQDVNSSFNSIRETTLHVAAAEHIWLQRMIKEPNQVWLQSTFTGTKDDHIKLWKTTSAALRDFLESFDEDRLGTNLDFKRLNGDAYSMPFYELLAHIFNHSTYHRGQLVTMLRQVGFKDVSSTDLLGYYREYF